MTGSGREPPRLACDPTAVLALAVGWPETLHRRWLPWVAVPRRDGVGKAPCARVGRRWQLVDATDSANGLTVDDALQAAQEAQRVRRVPLAGVGVALNASCGVVCVDLDGAWRDDRLTPFAQQVVDRLTGYTERSVTNGVHVLVQGRLAPGAPRRVRIDCDEQLELLTSYTTVTGQVLPGSPAHLPERQALLTQLTAAVAPRVASHQSPSPVVRPVHGTDAAVLDAARRSRLGERFAALYERGAWAELGLGRSEADASLIATLLRFSKGDRAQTVRLFEASALWRAKCLRGASRDGRSYAELTVDRVADFLSYAAPRS